MLASHMIQHRHTPRHPFYSRLTAHDSLPSSAYRQEHPQPQSPHTFTSQLADTRGWGSMAQAEFIPTRSGACALSLSQPKSTRAFASGSRHHPIATTAPFPLVTMFDALDAASSLSPVFATLTKNTRGGVSPLATQTLAPLPLYPVTVLELDCGLAFDPARADDDFFPALPPKPAVCLIESRTENAEPFLIRTQDLRRRLQRLLGPADPASKRLNLRDLARGVRYRLTGSALEQTFTYYQQAKQIFPKRYRKLTRLRPPAVLKISLRNAYPRCYVTRSIAVDETGAPTAGAYYGPFPSRKSALAF